jgi:CheY-like chemotaxis protein
VSAGVFKLKFSIPAKNISGLIFRSETINTRLTPANLRSCLPPRNKKSRRLRHGVNFDVIGVRDHRRSRDARIVLVLLDLSLPSKNGWNTVEELRAQNPKP